MQSISFMKNLVTTIYFLILSHTILAQITEIEPISKEPHKNKALNMIAAGYQIGGRSYVGFEYEFRFSKYIGLNVGAGIVGYTAGLKFHSCPCRTGPFLNVSFKDGGFGNIGTMNAEIGGILFFLDKKEKIGLLGQIGVGKIIYISKEMEEKLTKNNQIPNMIISFGVGLGWYFH